MNKNSKYITVSAMIAGLYTILTIISNIFGLANGAIQVRISEALCILPIFTPAAVPGLFVGCFISNIICDGVLLNAIIGSVATLIGAVGTRIFRKNKILAISMPIIINTIIIPFVLSYVYHIPGSLLYFAFTVFIGEFISVGIIGNLLIYSVKKHKIRL